MTTAQSDWWTTWEALASRIEMLERAASALMATVPVVGSDYHGMSNVMVIPAMQAAWDDLQQFQRVHQDTLPRDARDVLERLLEKGWPAYSNPSGLPGMAGLAAALAVIRSEMTSLLKRSEHPRVRVVERAFLHLNRVLAVDATVQREWATAFAAGEPACEKLGALHLLHHGVYGFKCDAAGERTDLMLGTRLAVTPEITAAMDALVLTEWKLVRDPADYATIASSAKHQARLYAMGSLGGVELATARYLVFVSHSHLPALPDERDGLVLYRHVNLAIAPARPSVAAKAIARSGQP